MPSNTTTLLAGAAAGSIGVIAAGGTAQASVAFRASVSPHHKSPHLSIVAVKGDVIQTPYGALQAEAFVARHHLLRIKVPVANLKDPITAFSTPKLIKEALRAQGANIHSVSGATWTSSAFSQSLQSALNKTRLRSHGSPLALPIPTAQTPPTIAGGVTVGSKLTAAPGTWTRNPTSYLYQWESCDGSATTCTPINGASDASYTVAAADSGHRLEVQVTAFAKLGPGYATSHATAVVPPAPPTAPTVVASPTITGSVAVGGTLTANLGSWTASPSSYGYQWADCDATGASCVAITGATSATYTIAEADAGHRIVLTVTATNAGGTGRASTSATVPVPTPVPSLSSAPQISGTPAVGQTLSVSDGAWTAAPTGYSYQWERCGPSGTNCTPIPSATGSTYTVTAADEGQTIAVRVEVTNAGGDAVALSPATVPVPVLAPVMTLAPEVTGQPQVGSALVVGDGVWSNDPTSFTYQWTRCHVSVDDDAVGAGSAPADDSGGGCTNIAGATGPTYTPTSHDVGDTLSVTVTARNAAGTTVGTSASTVSVIAAPTLAPALSTPPAITGTPTVGSELTAAPGVWTNDPTGYSYQWVACGPSGGCDAISGANGTTYTVQGTDVAKTIAVVVTAANTAGSSSALSTASAAVPLPAPAASAPPTITGTATLGSALIAQPGTWSNNPTFSYIWERCNTDGSNCAAIPGATGPTYTVTAADLGSAIVVTVTASNSGGVSSVTSSAAVAQSSPTLTSAPAISGSAAIGSTLTASSGSWSGSPTGYYYQWEDCNSAGTSCTPINGATGTTYTVTASDGNHAILVEVTAVNIGGSATADSSTTSVVPAPATATYTGNSYQAPSGNIDVQITVTGGEITAITTPQAPSNNTINNSGAISTLESEAFAAQTANGGKLSAAIISGLQGVSGATYTSSGFKSSLNDAVQAAIAAGTY